MDVGPVELLIVLGIVLLLFGSKKLPELAKGMGQAAKEFRSGMHDEDPESPAPTEAPATAVPATEASTTAVPATEVPATEVPATEAPGTTA